MGLFKSYFKNKEEKKRQEELLRQELLRQEKEKTKVLKIVFLAIIVVGIFSYFSYKRNFFKPQKEWITTVEGVKIYDFPYSKDAIYSWKGKNNIGYAHGKGILTIIENYDSIRSKRINLSYGSSDINDWIITSKGDYLGEKVLTTPEGFGILKKDDRILIGNFNGGILEGFIKEYKNNMLIYRGQYKDDNYNGFGTLYKNGEFIFSNWEDGQIKVGFIEEKKESVHRIWGRYFGDKDKIESDNIILPKEEFSALDEAEFKIYLATLLNDYINNRVTDITEDNTSFFSFEPIRMFWQSLFYTKNERMKYWSKEFTSNGLSKDDIEFFINSYINDFNVKNTNHLKLSEVRLSKLETDYILNDRTYNLLHDMEFAGWAENFWFDIGLSYISMFILTSLIGIVALPIFIPLKVLDLIVSIGVGIFVFILSIIHADIIPDFIKMVSENYQIYLLNQNIFDKI